MAQATNEKSEYVAIRNDEVRIFQLAYNVDGDAVMTAQGLIHERKTEVLSLKPGLNFVKRADLEKCLLPHETDDGLVSGRESLSLVEPTKLSALEARRLIAATSDKTALVAWLASEKRKPIVEALEARIG